jgi:hypothetical protein
MGMKRPGIESHPWFSTMKIPNIMFFLLAFNLFLFPHSVLSQSGAKPEWKYVATAEDDGEVWKTFYDSKNINRKSNGNVEVWLKQEPVTQTASERQRIVDGLIQNRKMNNMPTKGYDRFAYSLTLVEFDCKKKEGRNPSIRDYNVADELLATQTILDIPFAPVREKSLSRIILDAVCK